jgi:RNA polymerase sigma-70 factor, ECF subfamily
LPPHSHAVHEDEANALDRLRRGDLSALDMLVLRYQVEAVRTAFLIVRDHAAAEDITQAVFIRLAERAHLIDLKRPFAPYLFRSIAHEALGRIRRARRDVPLDDDDASLEALLPDWTHDPAATYDAAELRGEIWEAMGRLPARQRAAAVLRFYLDWSDAEIAAALAVPLGTVKWRLHEARMNLRRLLSPWAYSALMPGMGA